MLLSPQHHYMAAKFLDKWQRVCSAFPGTDRVHLRRIVAAVYQSCTRQYVDQLPLEAPPEEITAALKRALPDEDASLLRSEPISGLTADPERTLQELFARSAR